QPWPPADPTGYNPYASACCDDDDNGDGHKLDLPTSPWTYENGSVNPNLRPSNAYQRRQKGGRRRGEGGGGFVSSVPPYHPDYQDDQHDHPSKNDNDQAEAEEESASSHTDSEDYHYSPYGHRVRRGSEGMEVQPVDREEILRRYILSRGEEAGRYQRYEPEPASAS
ncbi:hypothetical protein BD410DRAFT_699683, partial [Rickenella mellea]